MDASTAAAILVTLFCLHVLSVSNEKIRFAKSLQEGNLEVSKKAMEEAVPWRWNGRSLCHFQVLTISQRSTII